MKAKEIPILLVVDDKPECLKKMVDTLFEADLEVNFLTAANGKAALHIAEQEKPDLILMDWDMPEMNGIEAVTEIKKRPELKYIPIVMTSGVMLSTRDLKKALDAGASDYIRKPFEKAELIARVNAQLNFGQSLKTILEQNKTLRQQETELSNLVEELQHIIEINEQLLTCNALQIGHYNTTLRKTHEELKKLASKIAGNEPKLYPKMLVISNKVKSALQSNVWANFEERFLASNPDFYELIKNDYPHLTDYDLRLCALIALNITYKDIALVLNITPQSVKTSRKRLRKKLNIPSKMDLYDFIGKYKK